MTVSSTPATAVMNVNLGSKMITKEQIRKMQPKEVQASEATIHEQWHEYCKDNTGTPKQQKIAEEALIELDETWY